MAPMIAPARPALHLTQTPSVEELRHWWAHRQADPDCAIAFADTAPQCFAEQLERLRSGTHLLYLGRTLHGEVVGAVWLHDVQYDPAGTPQAGWVGAYVLPAFRRSGMATTLWEHVRRALTAQGTTQVFAAVHIANRRSHAYATRHMGLRCVGLFPAFTRFSGVWTDCWIYTLRSEDADAAWQAAQERARELHQDVAHPEQRGTTVSSQV